MFLDLQFGTLREPLSGREWSPAKSRSEIARRVASYRARGLARGDRVLIRFGNRLEFFAELLALWELGACPVPVDSRLTDFEVNNGRVTFRFADVKQGDQVRIIVYAEIRGGVLPHPSGLTFKVL